MVGCESKGAGRSHSGLRGFFPLLPGSAASLFCAAICIESVIASLFCVAICLLFLYYYMFRKTNYRLPRPSLACKLAHLPESELAVTMLNVKSMQS